MFNIDMKEFISQHDIVYERAGATWRDGLPLGNGALGALAYAPFHPEFVINKNDVYDYSEAGVTPKTCAILRIAFGRDSTWTGSHLINQRLSLYDGCLNTRMDKHMSHPRIESIIPRGKNVLALRVKDVSHVSSFNNKVELTRHSDEGLQAPRISVQNGMLVLEQELSGGMSYAVAVKVVLRGGTAWQEWVNENYRPQYRPVFPESVALSVKGERLVAETGGDFDVYLAVVTSLESADPKAAAKSLAGNAASEGFDALYSANSRWWRDFWQKSFIKLDRPLMEQLWYFSLYQLASSYGVAPVPGLCGLWFGPDDETSQVLPWKGVYTNDQNSQMVPMPLFSANHCELAVGFYETFNSMIPGLKAMTQKVHGMAGIDFSDCCSPLRYSAGNLNQCGGPYHGLIYTWGYRYTMDKELLRRYIYPFLSEVCKFFAEYMTFEDSKGIYRLWPSVAPELSDFPDAANPTHTLSLLKVCMKQAVQAAEVLGCDEEWVKRWRDILSGYPPYPVEDGIIVEAEGIPANNYTNQYGGTYPVFPCGEFGSGSPDGIKELIKETFVSFDTRFTLLSYADTGGRNHFFNGWSWFFAGMVSLRMGWQEKAWDLFWEQPLRCFLKPNGLFVHNAFLVADPAETEANISSIPDALVMDKEEAMPLKEPMKGNSYSEATPNWEAKETVFPVLEMSSAYLTFINETLLQSYGGIIRVFPCVEEAFSGGFDSLMAEGAFLVSAWMEKSRVLFVRLKSTAGGRMTIQNPWPGDCFSFIMNGGEASEREGAVLEIDTAKGDEFILYKEREELERAGVIKIRAERLPGPNALKLNDGTVVWLGKPDFKSGEMQEAAYRNYMKKDKNL